MQSEQSDGEETHHRQNDLLPSVHPDCQREAVVSSGAQQSAGRPCRGAHQGLGSSEGLQEHAVGEMRECSGPDLSVIVKCDVSSCSPSGAIQSQRME